MSGRAGLALPAFLWRLRRPFVRRRPRRAPDPAPWERAWRELGLTPPPGLLEELAKLWQEPWRAYHTVEHLENGLGLMGEYRHLAAKPAELAMAFYFHDAVYDPLLHDNEARSAALAAGTLAQAGAPRELAVRIGELVMATQHVAEPPDDDAALLVDVDLAILGAGREDYDRYEKAVREEYVFVPGDLFRAKRREILATFLARPAIYRNPALRERFEAAARANLARAIAALR